MKKHSFYRKNIFLLGFFVLFGIFLNLTPAQAQSDKERSYSDLIKAEEPSLAIKETVSDYTAIKREQPEKSVESRDYGVHKERVSADEREPKQEVKSTLSFNLFLYVIDRFKEN